MWNENDIVKLVTKDEKEVFVSIFKIYDDNSYRVKILKQPFYEISSIQYSTSLFKQFCHEDDEFDFVLMGYDSETMTINVLEAMIKDVTHNEIVDLLKYFNHISFGEKENKHFKREKMIISEALERLYIFQ